MLHSMFRLDVTGPMVDSQCIYVGNHVDGYAQTGSNIAMGLSTSHRPCKIVCYTNYNSPISSIMHRILHDEIRIDKFSSIDEKKTQLVSSIGKSLADGYDVAMFIDAEDRTRTMRTLNKHVLEQFPHTKKQLLQIHEPIGHVFRVTRHEPTEDVDEIVEQRKIILSRKYTGNV